MSNVFVILSNQLFENINILKQLNKNSAKYPKICYRCH